MKPGRIGRTRTLHGLDAWPKRLQGGVATIGVFDGVHAGHRALIRRAVLLARRLHTFSVVITFDPDPHSVLNPEKSFIALTSLAERCRRIATLGPDYIWILPFTRKLAQVPAETFARRVLLDRLAAISLVVGEDFAFGRGAKGGVRLLRQIGAKAGMHVITVRPVLRGGAVVSSSRIRAAIHNGELAQARRLLGWPPVLSGTVIRGSGRGRLLRVPTANLKLMPQVLPPTGVYASIASAGSRRWPAVMNLGVRPTFGGGPVIAEVHLLGFSGALYGKSLQVSLIQRLRSERCFASSKALVRQIHRDLSRAKSILSRYL